MADPNRSTHNDTLARNVELSGKRVVDVGCGSGELVRWLRSQGADAVGVECGEIMMRQARAADPDHHDAYLDGVGQALPLPTEHADVVVMSYSLHHIPRAEMVNALREAHRVLKPGGTLFVAEPVPAGPGHEVVRIIDDETEVRGFAQDALRSAPSIGFTLVNDTSYMSRMVLASAEGFAERIVGIDPSRAANLEAHRAEFIEAFHRLGEPVDGGYAFDSETLVKVFTRD